VQPQVFPFNVSIVPKLADKPLDGRQRLRPEQPDGVHTLLRGYLNRPRQGSAPEQPDDIPPTQSKILTLNARS
jgi:hypothetical protein